MWSLKIVDTLTFPKLKKKVKKHNEKKVPFFMRKLLTPIIE